MGRADRPGAARLPCTQAIKSLQPVGSLAYGPAPMHRTESLYLDLVRVCAALLVVSYHAHYYTPGVLPFTNFGHDAVVIFFVLSGYVIAYVTGTRERTLTRYTVSRLSRLMSVVVPALALTVIADAIGRASDGAVIYERVMGYAGDWPVIRVLSALTFTAELWFVSIVTLSNNAFWSLSFEFWYYVIYACWVFVPGRGRYVATAVACLIVGPKILLLFPLWLMGVWLYRTSFGRDWKPIPALVIFVGSLTLYLTLKDVGALQALNQAVWDVIGPRAVHYLPYARFFPGDYVVGLCIVANFAALRALAPRIDVPGVIDRAIRLAAGFTFSIYLYHYPLLLFWGAVLWNRVPDSLLSLCAVSLTFVVIVALGLVTEWRKEPVRRWFTWLLQRAPLPRWAWSEVSPPESARFGRI